MHYMKEGKILVNIFNKKSQKKLIANILLIAITINFVISPLSVFAGNHLNELEEVVALINAKITSSNSYNDSKKETCDNEKYCLKATDDIKTEISKISDNLSAITSGVTLDKLVSKSGATIENYNKLSSETKNKVINYQSAEEIKEEFIKKEASCSVLDEEENPILDKETCEIHEGTWEDEEIGTVLITVDDIESMFLGLFNDVKGETIPYDSEEKYNETYESKVNALRNADKAKAVESKATELEKISNATAELNTLNEEFATFNDENPDFSLSSATEESLNSYLALQKKAYNFSDKIKSIKDSYSSFMNNETYSYAYQDEWEEFTSDLTESYNNFIENSNNYSNKDEITDKLNKATDIDNLTGIEQSKSFLESFKENLKTNYKMISEENIKKIDKKLLNTYYVLKSSTDNIIVNHTDRIVEIMIPKLSTDEILNNLDIDFKDNIVFNNTVNLTDIEGNQINSVKTDSTLDINDSNGSSVGKYTIVVNGDITSDGNVDGSDLQELEALVLKNKTTSDFSNTKLMAADYNNDKSYNIVDIVMMYQTMVVTDSGVEG